MNLDEAVKRACEKPTLLDALSYICVWDCDRAVKQALEYQKTGVSTAAKGGWDTCFKVCLKAVMAAWGKRWSGASGGCRYLKVASTSESVDHDCELGLGVSCEACPIARAKARVSDLVGLYAAAVKRLQDLGETEVPLAPREASGMKTQSAARVAAVIGWLRRLKERYVDPEDVDDGEELTLDVVEHLSEHIEALEAVLRDEEWGS